MFMKAISTAFFILWASVATAADYTFTTFTVPGAKHTQAFAINDHGDLVGMWGACDFCQAQAFLYSDGKYYDVAVSGAARTIPFGINRDGVIAGSFTNNGQFAFLMDGTKTTVLEDAERADAINNLDAVVGYRVDAFMYGYVWENGQYITPVTINEIPGILGSALTGINDAGDTVGYYFYDTGPCCSNQVTQGFLRTKAGKLTPLEILPLGINKWGQIVGLSGAGSDGAILDENGVAQLIKVPGADYTQVHGINNVGHIVGYYLMGGQYFGFVAKETPLSKSKAKRLKEK
jgi:uncharacterized membrane protein